MISLYYPNLSNKTCTIRSNETKSWKGSPAEMKPVLGRPTSAKAQQQGAACHGGSVPSGTACPPHNAPGSELRCSEARAITGRARRPGRAVRVPPSGTALLQVRTRGRRPQALPHQSPPGDPPPRGPLQRDRRPSRSSQQQIQGAAKRNRPKKSSVFKQITFPAWVNLSSMYRGGGLLLLEINSTRSPALPG